MTMTTDVTSTIRLAEALIVVDVQVAFVSGVGAAPRAEPVTQVVSALVTTLVTRARAAGAVIVHPQNDGPARAVDEPGTPAGRRRKFVQCGP
jgi:streptothricin hydrolase